MLDWQKGLQLGLSILRNKWSSASAEHLRKAGIINLLLETEKKSKGRSEQTANIEDLTAWRKGVSDWQSECA